jgi:hypothetical protein
MRRRGKTGIPVIVTESEKLKERLKEGIQSHHDNHHHRVHYPRKNRVLPSSSHTSRAGYSSVATFSSFS